ncbi:zinc-dependent alcohol dehydrogenase [Saccharopolyspora hattusasensis]|uniref:zinc-dependent alcohol dehydrogenase n=1 Tax=Saccharopolyspora hattusasensis TaxID=1128679 RepID=UPI003D963ACE
MAVYVEAPGRWRWSSTAGDQAAEVFPSTELVQLKLVSAGICGTDLSVLTGTNPLARYPLVLGHECLAQVTEGSGANLPAGTYAIVFPTVSCGTCPACHAGWENRCPDMEVFGLSHPYGCFQPSLRMPASQLIPMPTAAAQTTGPLLEPLAVAAHILLQAALAPDDNVVVFGAGVIGLSVGIAAQASGAASVSMIDQFDTRRDVAAACGLTELVIHRPGDDDSAALDPLAECDVVIDTVSTTASANAALGLLSSGGRYVAVGSPHTGAPLAIDYDRLYARELSIATARNYTRRDFTRALDLLQHQSVDLSPLVTARYALEDFEQAVRELTTHPERHVKTLLTPNDTERS